MDPWTIASPRELKRLQNSPGPAAYTIQSANWDHSPRFALTKAQRFSTPLATALGPGKYAHETGTPAKGWQFDRSPRTSAFEAGTKLPGPGKYEAVSSLAGPAYSLYARRRSQPPASGPGPGSYDSAPLPKRSLVLEFGKRPPGEAVFEPKFGPGPGVYNPVQPVSPVGTKFGSEHREYRVNSQGPGPGTYNAPANVRKNAYTIARKGRTEVEQSAPGPGSYEYQPKDTRLAPAMGVAARFPTKRRTSMPGPGEYSVVTPKYLRQKRTSFDVANPKRSLKYIEKGATLKGPFKELSVQESPGPGQYEHGHNATFGTKFSKSIRQGFPHHSEDIPGPGTYKEPSRKPKKESCGFGSGRRDVLLPSQEPGPGNYTIPSSIGKVPTYSLSPSKAFNYV